MTECLKCKEFINNVCSRCKNRRTDLCNIVRKIDGTYGCSEEERIMRKFEKVERVKDLNFNLPIRKTAKSAGYDIECIEDITIPPYHLGDKPTLVPTGLKVCMEDNEYFMLVNRSSNPKKKNLVIPNSMGIIDADYYNNPENEGEFAFAFYNLSNEPVTIEKGYAIGQGIFCKYGITDDDNASGKRLGGFGSTNK